MTDSTPETADSASKGGYWPDDTVDAIAALVVVGCITLGLLWFVMNG